MKTPKQYKKKIVVIDEKTTPHERGVRLKMLRSLSKLMQKELGAKCGVSESTIINWEKGRFGGLPLDGANKVVNYLIKENVYCTVDWLLYEIGDGPRLIGGRNKTHSAIAHLGSNEKTSITDEILVFRKHFPDAISLLVNDDGTEPFYQPGDYVAGIKHYGNDIEKCIGLTCIVQTSDGKEMLRSLRKGENKRLYTLLCTNPNTKLQKPTLYNISLNYAAPIIRHYRQYIKNV